MLAVKTLPLVSVKNPSLAAPTDWLVKADLKNDIPVVLLLANCKLGCQPR
jgi:hypothetical protein